MIRPTIISAIALLASTASAEDRRWTLTDFTKIDADGCFELVVTVAEDFSVEASGSERAFRRLELVRDGRTLEVEREQRNCDYSDRDELTVRVSMPSLAQATFGAGIAVDISGIDGGDIELEATTGAEVEIRGRCDHFELAMNTGATLDARQLRCRSVEVEANTGATADIHAEESVRAEASLGAEIDIFGPAEQVRTSELLGGDVDIHKP